MIKFKGLLLIFCSTSLFGQDINFSSEYNRISWPVALGLSGGITGDDGSYKRLALYHGGSISLQTGSNSPGISNSRLFINTTGQVGIGTASPGEKLDVQGNINMPLQSAIGFGISSDKFNYDGKALGNYSLGWSNDSWSGAPTTYLSGWGGIKFFTATTPRLSILSNGNVGIGTTSPLGRLNVDMYSPNDDNQLVIQNDFGWPSISSRMNISFRSTTDIGNWEVGRITVNPSTLTNTWNETSNGTMRFRLMVNGALQDILTIDRDKVGIGTTSPDAKLTVSGQVHAQEVKVTVNAPGPDYVFEKDYKLTSLEEIKNYIDQNKHLPEVPSAKEMEKNGVQLGEMNMLLLKKIEELTLYVIEQEKRIKQLETKNTGK